jgi:hypothetical protein
MDNAGLGMHNRAIGQLLDGLSASAASGGR